MLRNSRVTFLFLISPSLILVLSIFLYPLFSNLWFSFQSVTGTMFSESEGFVGFENYIKILKMGSSFLNSLLVTGVYTLAVVVGQLVLALIIALAINRLKAFQTILNTMLLIPWITTPVVKALMWGLIINYRWGILNYILGLVGIPPQQWLSKPSLALFSVIVIGIWTATPRTALILLAGLKTLPVQLLEASEIDGASDFDKFIAITLPMIKPAILVSLIFSTIQVIRQFDVIFVLTGGGPGNATNILSLALHKYYFHYWDVGGGAAGSIIFMLLTLIISLIYINTMLKEK